MTPAARYGAAITILDAIGDGAQAEQTLTNWARQNRYAGSKDRAAIRDHVYDILRARASLAAWGGGTTGRALVLGLLRRDGIAPETVFGAGGYAPPALSQSEQRSGQEPEDLPTSLDVPSWLWPQWEASLGEHAEDAARQTQMRGPVALRVNLSRTSREDAQAVLRTDDIATSPVEDVPTALLVESNPRRVATSAAFTTGLVELQDVASQIAMQRLLPHIGGRALDYCTGGGGKALALADLTDARIAAHDVAVQRTRDVLPRAARAGVDITLLRTAELTAENPFDLVLCDAPCSGSGTWRRAPAAKWALTPEGLRDYVKLQAEIIDVASKFVRDGGVLAYATCSVLTAENDDVVAGFLSRHPGWKQVESLRLQPTATHDGFFLAILQDSR